MPELMPLPETGESEEHFIIRAHRALMEQLPEPDERNRAIWNLWWAAHGPSPASVIASKTFGDRRFRMNPSVCLFAEHETNDAQGNRRKYTLPELIRITRTCNERIVDFDGFAPLTDGHTPNPDDMDQTDPPVVGYAGPYRLGMIGRVNPRWAIFADEWHYSELADQLSRKPRRSVELWTFANDPVHAHFDPVAVLGAEAPRLSLPARYHAQQMHGVTVTRYSAPAFASPGGSNTFVREPVKGAKKVKSRYWGPGCKGKSQYGTEDYSIVGTPQLPKMPPLVERTPTPPVPIPGTKGRLQTSNPLTKGVITAGQKVAGRFKHATDDQTDPIPVSGGQSMLSNEDLGQLLQALAETPQFKFIDQMMQQQQAPGGGEPVGGEPAGDEFADESPDDLGDVSDMLLDDEDGSAPPDEGGGGGEEGPPVAEEEEEPEEKNTPLAAAGLAAGLGRAGAAIGPALAKAAPMAKAIAPHALLGASGYMGAKAGGRAAAKQSRNSSGQSADKYSRLKSAHNKLVQEHGRLAQRMIQLERDKTDAERVAVLQGLSGRYPDFVDMDQEFQTTLYSRGANMSDKAFAAHVGTVEKYAHKASMTRRAESPDLPVGALPAEVRDPAAEKYSARLTREAVKIHTAAINAGKDGYTWEQAKQEAEKVLGARR